MFEDGWSIPESDTFRPIRPLPAIVESALDGLEHNGRRVWTPSIVPKTGESRFWRLSDNYTRPMGAVRWLNEPKGHEDRGGLGYGFPRLSVTPLIRREHVLKPFDLYDTTAHWVVSQRTKDILESIDPSGVVFIKLDNAHIDGRKYPFESYWMDVTRGMHAFDVEYSNLVFSMAASGERWVTHIGPARFRSDINPNIHVFREGGGNGQIYVSSELMNIMLQENLQKPRFEDPAARYLIR